MFQKLTEFEYGERLVSRYQLVTRFYQKRVPFVILICGTGCMGKSTLVTQLAEKVNISNILQTSVVKNVIENFGKIEKQEAASPTTAAAVADEDSQIEKADQKAS